MNLTLDMPSIDADMNLRFVSEEIIRIMEISLTIPVNCLVSSAGALANLINILVLAQLGFKNSMSVGTVALSLSDLMVTTLQLASELCLALYYALTDSWIDFLALSQIAIGWLRYAGIYISGWITTVIAVERCFCVVLPFRVKQMCSRTVYVVVIIIICGVYLSLILPIYLTERFLWLREFTTEMNSSASIRYVFSVMINEEAARMEIQFDTIGVVGFALLSQFILLVCTACMVYSLRASSLVRLPTDDTSSKPRYKKTDLARSSALSVREKRLVRVAIWLAVVMTTCNIPRYIVIAIFSYMPELIGYCGIVGNVINILSFSKQGFQDSVNVTLTALAVSDLGALLCQTLLNILASPFWNNMELPFSSFAIFAMLFFYPHGYFIRASGFITSFAAFERCLCVVLPLKVKSIITRNVAVAVNSLIFLILLLYLFPEYYVSYLGLVHIPVVNRTVLTIFYRNNAEFVLTITNIVNDLLLPYITFLILIICNTVIAVKLKSKATWRQSVSGKKATSSLTKVEISTKERKVVAMLVVVSAIFVTCLTPQCVMMTVIGVIQDLKVEGPYFNLTMLIYSFTSLLETVNCSVTFLVYYNMSTRYREIIQSWFPRLQTWK
ncbi:hypothetical protein Btru_017555 [Bulinus truncatus]|nr:hypothetical protein Btru_017555 [Bulinus truncatus]